MVALSNTNHETVSDTYEDNKPRWKNSLRASVEKDQESKPLRKPGPKANSPRNNMSTEEGSLGTNRRKPRSQSETRSPRSMSRDMSPSPRLFVSTVASRAKQREAIVTSRLSRAPSVSSTKHARQRARSASPTRSAPARKPSLHRQASGRRYNNLPKPNDEKKEAVIKIPYSLPNKAVLGEKYNFTANRHQDSTQVHKFSLWLGPSDNPLDFNHFKKNFEDFSHEKSEYKDYSRDKSKINCWRQENSSKNGMYKKSVSYADTSNYVALGFRVL